MQDDERCCGTGTCIIDAAGRCWCGQQWDGEKMCMPAREAELPVAAPPAAGAPDTSANQGPSVSLFFGVGAK